MNILQGSLNFAIIIAHSPTNPKQTSKKIHWTKNRQSKKKPELNDNITFNLAALISTLIN